MPLPPPEMMEFNDRRNAGLGYGRQDTPRLHPARLGTPIAETVEMLIDERSADFGRYLADVRNLDLVVTRLPAGDLCAVHGDRALLFSLTHSVEICEALDDGRLAKLAQELARIRHPACIIVEGGIYQARRQPLARLTALHSRLIFAANVNVVETIDRHHSAYFIACAVRDHFFAEQALARLEPQPARLRETDARGQALRMLSMIPGLSLSRADALLSQFGNIAEISKASPREIAIVDGIGTIVSKRISEALTGTKIVEQEEEDPGAGWTRMRLF